MIENHIKDSEETWNAIAKSFDATRRKPWKQCIDFIEALPRDSTVADIACGNGRHLIPCAHHCKKVIGVDISKELLDIVQTKIKENNIKNVTLLHSDAAKLPIKTDSLDAVIFIAALHNIKNRSRRIQTLEEIRRVLKKHGKALISVWSRWQDKYRKQFFKKWFVQLDGTEFGDIDIYWRQHGLNIPRFYHLYSKREFLSDLRKAGLEILDSQNVKLHSKKHPDNYFAITKK
ncbi:MAG: class I SAM-dependent methyltransferase [Thermoplasmatales archaeon]|nr:MAG: class I SAM-dependent methyltransferase [Thermoplasmatales archaeon]